MLGAMRLQPAVSWQRGCRAFRSIATGGRFSLPILDLSPFMGASTPSSRLEAAKALDEACSTVGFFYLEGHGIDTEEINHLHRLSKQFFSLPTTVKEEIAMSAASPTTGRGYQRLGENVTLQMRDWQEAIDFFADIPAAEIDMHHFAQEPVNMGREEIAKLEAFTKAPNLWPAEPAAFRTAAEAYFSKVSAVGEALMQAMALGLGLPQHFFDALTDRSFWCVRVIGYPALHREQLNLSCGEHTDYGCWTILAQDETPDALEVQLPDGTWEKVQPRPGAFVVNLGDMLSVWTKGRYVATRHRVRQTAGDYRTSIAFFYEPNFDAVIHPLDLSALNVVSPVTLPTASTEPLARGLAGGKLIYGEHLFAKVTSNFNFGSDDTT